MSQAAWIRQLPLRSISLENRGVSDSFGQALLGVPILLYKAFFKGFLSYLKDCVGHSYPF